MSYKLKPIKDKSIRNKFVTNNFGFYTFLNSREWWEFQKLEWEKIFRLGIYDEADYQVGQILLIKIVAKRGIFFLAPHAPLIKENYFEALKDILPELKSIARKEQVSFVRFCPQTKNTKKHLKDFKDLGMIYSPLHMHAEDTHLLDIKQDEETLLKNMRKTTRYLIKRATKEWVKTYQDNSAKNIQHFIKMHNNHSQRTNWKHTYTAFSDKYIINLFKAFDEKNINLMNADYNDFTEASLATIKFGTSCSYYLWASDTKHPKFSPAYLLQRKAIQDAKNNNCISYNFRWVSPDKNPKHPLQWVSLFKRGFGGEDYRLSHAMDFICSKKYRITFIIETIRRIKRGYYFVKPKE